MDRQMRDYAHNNFGKIDDQDDCEEAVFGRFPRGGGSELRISRNVYNGSDLIDLRLWLSNGTPTRRGVTVDVQDVDAVIGGLRAARGV